MLDGPIRRPALSQIIRTDHAAAVGVIVPCIGIGLWIANAFFGFPGDLGRPPLPPNHPLFVILAAAGVIAGMIVLMSRRRYFDALFATGARAPGTITSISFLQQRGIVDFTFDYQGQPRQARNRLHRTKRTAALRPRQAVTVLVDPAEPAKAILLDLYV
jgi:hypothetical protein